MGILDAVSRLSLSTDDILTASNRTIAEVGPFTDALLGKHVITDIIRDAEEGEQTLFTHRSLEVGGVKGPVDPRPVAIGGGGTAGIGVREKEQDVDIILNAALRLVENYGSMPRAKSHVEDLLDRASEARSRISLLDDELDELKNAEPASAEPEMPSLKDEERIVVKMEAQLNAARRRRDALREQIAQKQRSRSAAQSQHGNTIATPTAAARTRTRPGGGKIPNPFLARMTSSLPEGDPDATTNISIHISGGIGGQSFLIDEGPPQWADDSVLSGTVSEDAGVETIWDGQDGDGYGEDEGDGEGTVVLAIPPAVGLSPPASPVRSAAPAPVLRASIAPTPARAPAVPPVVTAPPPPVVEPAPAKPPPEPKPKVETPAPKPKQVKVTAETEANTGLIWSTVGKVLVPSSNYGPDTPGPDVLETASILQSLSSQSLASSDPQPILTATLLLYLLQNGPSSLPSVRAALADKEKESESANGLGIKALYACVAKKLLKIDRKGREATVRFE
ncbi:hypothetical protein RSOLAG1IB_02076 [Rhizoctonia solani AG-1 IB]|uniref:Uncharacterized protein n=1 Tax=Thanatephorus cucumeris (strain AG1-IB / isolate 7/3/14) TaxID=1108050 RepID=A0A0B7FMC2_THACB|nr:hypothetical protein RSOLAG1IB_02076 [Rhizoctonia solani AG-1 IB]